MVESTEIMVRSTFFPGTIHEHHAKFPRFHGEIPPVFPCFLSWPTPRVHLVALGTWHAVLVAHARLKPEASKNGGSCGQYCW
jgi:hypothetical protein